MTAAYLFFIKLGGAMLSVVLGAYIANTYGAGVLGKYSILLVLINVMALISSWGLSVQYMVRFQGGPEEGRELAFFLLTLFFAFLVLPGALLVSRLFVGGSLWLAAPAFIVAALLTTKVAMLAARGLQVPNSLFDDVARTAVPLATIVAASWASSSLAGAAADLELPLAYLVGHCALGIVLSLYLYRSLQMGGTSRQALKYIARNLRSLVREGLVTTAALLLILLVSQSDRLVVSRLLNHQTLGIYAVAQAGANFFTYAVQSMVAAVTPELVAALKSNNRDKIRIESRKHSIFLFVVGLCMCGFAFLFGDVFFSLYGIVSREGVIALAILLAGQSVSQLFGFGITMVTYSANRSALIYSHALGLIVGLSLCWLLTLQIGIAGAAVATSGGVVFVKFLLWIHCRRQGFSVGI